MDIDRIRELLQVAAQSDAAEVEFEEGGTRLVVRRNAPPVVVQPQIMLPSLGGIPQAEPAAVAPASMPAATENAPAEAALEPEAIKNGVLVHAPTPGTFFEAPTPDAEPFVTVGDVVEVGDTLCIIEAMKLMNEIECEVAGNIREVYTQNGEPVEYDQPLFLIEPA